MTSGEKLKELRGNLSLATVSNEIGITPQALWNYENDIRAPRDEIKRRIARYYNLLVGEIFFDEKVNI